MALRWLAGSALCALVLMIWGYLFWVGSARSSSVFHQIPGSSRLHSVLKEELPNSGGYVFPPLWPETGLMNPRGMEEMRGNSQQGPTGLVLINSQGVDPFSKGNLILHFLVLYLASLTASLFLILTQLHLGTPLQRWLFLMGLGVFSVFSVRLGDVVWLRLPWNYAFLSAGFTLSQWAVGGLVLAFLIHPSSGFRVSDQRLPLWKRARDF
ncbi:MAG: hypothetical protein OEW39_07365 [Deltaproteobacteria bacterium]|nr:hypothetical protein [Deltaproteobacteria bacterium]